MAFEVAHTSFVPVVNKGFLDVPQNSQKWKLDISRTNDQSAILYMSTAHIVLASWPDGIFNLEIADAKIIAGFFRGQITTHFPNASLVSSFDVLAILSLCGQ